MKPARCYYEAGTGPRLWSPGPGRPPRNDFATVTQLPPTTALLNGFAAVFHNRWNNGRETQNVVAGTPPHPLPDGRLHRNSRHRERHFFWTVTSTSPSARVLRLLQDPSWCSTSRDFCSSIS
ncbi:hypothetical protein PIB30_027704 [Stylosanthes scabra]|uniref:Uncharacterized protein n=1 Tax=Stylosanthes scabra TaxID=79078 RepID=A0ABU6V9M9_9FABA|nr:hypothetical protein [Stylosanthes scabra]